MFNLGSLIVSYSQESLGSLGAKRLIEVTNVVQFEELREGETLFEEGDPSMVRIGSVCARICPTGWIFTVRKELRDSAHKMVFIEYSHASRC